MTPTGYNGRVLPLLLAACTGSQTIGTDSHETGDSASPADTAGDTGGAPPRDIDEDGYPAGEDCMDLNAAVHPGAEELWNELDDDCDGKFDADGEWSGTLNVETAAVYEGKRYSFSTTCPFTGVRAVGAFDWVVVCTSDGGDEMAQLLLGALYTLRPREQAVELERWDGDVILESSSGWDTDADGTILWSTFDRALVAVSLSAASLSMGVEGTILRQ